MLMLPVRVEANRNGRDERLEFSCQVRPIDGVGHRLHSE
jgi:hypothetical protein